MDNPYQSPHTAETLLTDIDDGLEAHDTPLFGDRAFWGITATQFLGAFNDNVFKQLMLLLAIPVGAAAADKADEQGLATMVFSLPFVLFSGLAGYLSDRFSKRRVIVLCKLAEIGIMLLGMLGFLAFGITGYRGLLVVLFLMGTHSAFFGPGKYGILPELFREEDLPRANGVILMTTFLAIIFGTASAGLLGDLLTDAAGQRHPERLWIGSLFCIGVAVLGTCTSLLIRPISPAVPKLRFQLSALAIPPETRKLLLADRPLLGALLVSCLFWLVSGVAMQSVNSLGMTQLGVGERRTSLLTAVIGLGIAVGAVIAGRLSRGKVDFRLVTWGGWGMIAGMLLLAVSLPAAGGGYRHLLGYGGSFPVLIWLGMAAGTLAIPVQVFIQTRPPEDQKGRMIAVMNLTNFIAILLSGAIYMGFDRLIEANGWPRSVLFALTAALILPVAVFYRGPRERADGTKGT
jgi:acyl-[acyl-carrier-protein]-phospholipid O-acyltransferase/long-chain-fatty-acid--[acyl-carrier-protein] ligase